MSNPPSSLAELTQAARSDQQVVRSGALQELLAWATRDPGSYPTVLPIFRKAIAAETDPYGIVSAAKGIAHVIGGQEARNAWLTVLNHPAPEIVVCAASAVTDLQYAPLLLDLLVRRPEASVRNAAIWALGRMEYTEALPAILSALDHLETRWEAIESLRNLGDARAIPYLEPFLDDQSALRGQDDRGCTIDVRDITGDAIRRLEHLAKIAPAPITRPAPGGSARSGPPSQPLPAPPPARAVRVRHNPFAYLPLAAALLEIPWIVIVFTQVSIPVKEATRAANAARNHQLDVLAAIPVAAGVLIGAVILLRGTARRLPERICIYLGCAGCAAFLYALGREFLN